MHLLFLRPYALWTAVFSPRSHLFVLTTDKSFFVPGFDIHSNGLEKAENDTRAYPFLDEVTCADVGSR